MRIYEILIWNNCPDNDIDTNYHFDFPENPFRVDIKNLANIFTRQGLVKRLWNVRGSEAQTSGPESPDPQFELDPSGTPEPTTAYLPAELVDEGPPSGLHRLFPFRDYREVARDRRGLIKSNAILWHVVDLSMPLYSCRCRTLQTS